nr:Inner membrane protein YdjM [Candidatus Pantoea persica]
MDLPLILNLAAFVALLLLSRLGRGNWSLSKKVLVGLTFGVLFGLALQSIYGAQSEVLKTSISWFKHRRQRLRACCR